MEPLSPMEPMKPMAPMKPMESMKPIAKPEAWWPGDLGEPSTSGSQNGLRYAVFPQKHRLLVQRDGEVTTYDSGDHQIGGVSQQESGEATVAFTSQSGPVRLEQLKRL